MGTNPFADATFETTDAEMLDIIDLAISRIATLGEEARIGNRTYKEGDLGDLRELRAYYADRVASAATPVKSLAQFRKTRTRA